MESRLLALWQFLYYYERFCGCPFRPAVTDPLIIIVPPHSTHTGLLRLPTMQCQCFVLMRQCSIERLAACPVSHVI